MMPALKESSASLSAAMQLPLSVPPLETDREVATVVVVGARAARREKIRRNIAAAAPWKEDRGVAAIVLFWFSL
jgi:hypothetical protein